MCPRPAQIISFLASSVCLTTVYLNYWCSFIGISLISPRCCLHIDRLCSTLASILSSIPSLRFLDTVCSWDLFLTHLLTNTISDNSDAILNAHRSIIFQDLLFSTKASSCTIGIFRGKSVMHLTRSFWVWMIGFSSCLWLCLLLMRCFDKGTICRRGIPNKITIFTMVFTPAIDWVILNNLSKWILFQHWLSAILIRIESFYDVVRRSSDYRRFEVFNSTFCLLRKAFAWNLILVLLHNSHFMNFLKTGEWLLWSL